MRRKLYLSLLGAGAIFFSSGLNGQTAKLADVLNLNNRPISMRNESGLLGVRIRDCLIEYTKNKEIPVIGGAELKGSWKAETDKSGMAFISSDIPEDRILTALRTAFGSLDKMGNAEDPLYVIPAAKLGASIWVGKRGGGIGVCIMKPLRF